MVAFVIVNLFSSASIAASSGLIVEAGSDQSLTLGDTLTLTTQAYVQNLSTGSLSSSSITWGDGVMDVPSISFDAFAMYLQGSHTYSAAGVYTVMVCADDDGFGELCDTFTATVSETVTTFPDLIVSSVTYNYIDNSLDFVVDNTGAGDVAGVDLPNLNFYFDFFNSDLSASTAISYELDSYSTDYRTAGGSTTVNTGPVGTLPSCEIYVLLVADGNGEVLESDDSNNEYRGTIDTCTTDNTPDFVVSGLEFYSFIESAFVTSIPAGSDPSDYNIYFTITNNGADATVADTSLAYNETQDESGTVLIQHSFGFIGSTDFLNSGGSSNDNAEEITVGLVDVSGVTVLQFCTDTGDYVLEADETNNCLTYDNPFYTGSTEPATLAVDAGTDEAMNLGVEMFVNAVVTNSAVSDADLINTVDWGDGVIESLDATLTGTHMYAVAGVYTVVVAVDDGVSTASDSLVVTVTDALLPDLIIDSVTLNANNTVHFVVSNRGTEVLTSEDIVTVALYDQTTGDGSVTESYTLNDLGTSYQAIGGSIEFDSAYVLPTLPTTILAVVDPANDIEELNEGTFEANYYRATFAAPATTETATTSGGSGGGGNGIRHSSSNSDGSTDSDSNSDVVLTGSEDVVLTEEEVAACGEMSFLDVAADDANYDSIYRMWCEGVVHGRDSQHFAPSDFIQRDEVSKIVSRLFGYVTTVHEELPLLTETSYEDVSVAEPLTYYVQTLTDEGFYSDEETLGNFRPHEDMKYSEIVDLIEQVTLQEVSLDGYIGDDNMTRGSFASFVFSYFE